MKIKIMCIVIGLFPAMKAEAQFRANLSSWAHYDSLVRSDSIYYRNTGDSAFRIQMGKHYNSLAWHSMLVRKFDHVEYYLHQSMQYDPEGKYPYTNLPLFLLWSKHFEEAKAMYLKLKSQPFDNAYPTCKDVFLIDFKELERRGAP